jgi:6-phospho-beta-glucosidase
MPTQRIPQGGAAVGIKLAVIGGGSSYTPELVEGIGRRIARIVVDELVLHDVDAGRLEVVGGMARRQLRRLGFPGRLTLTTARERAVEGAAFVLVQLRVGGLAARLQDETVPLRFGCLGQETTGPGGFAKALRTIPVVLDIAEDMARWAAPDAWLVDFTNPSGVVTQALLDQGHRAIGLCNVPIGFQRDFARRLGVAPQEVRLDHVGLNHLSWERKAVVAGVDRLPELLERDGEALARSVAMPLAILRASRAVPSYYLRYYFLTAQVIEEQRAGRPRALDVMDIDRDLMEQYSDPALDVKPKRLEERGGAFYSEAAMDLIESLHTGRGDVQVVNTRNDRAIPGLDADAVVETGCRIDASGAHPLPTQALAPEMHGLVAHAKAYERLTVAAAMSGDRQIALKALLTNPLVREYDVAEPLLGALLEAGREHLPRFSPS